MPRRVEINPKKAAIVTLLEAVDSLPDYPLGDLLYAALRRLARTKGGNIKFLREVSDEDILYFIDKAITEEIEREE